MEKIIRENAFEQKKKKPGWKFNTGLAVIGLQTAGPRPLVIALPAHLRHQSLAFFLLRRLDTRFHPCLPGSEEETNGTRSPRCRVWPSHTLCLLLITDMMALSLSTHFNTIKICLCVWYSSVNKEEEREQYISKIWSNCNFWRRFKKLRKYTSITATKLSVTSVHRSKIVFLTSIVADEKNWLL